jgi:hypothetical protein
MRQYGNVTLDDGFVCEAEALGFSDRIERLVTDDAPRGWSVYSDDGTEIQADSVLLDDEPLSQMAESVDVRVSDVSRRKRQLFHVILNTVEVLRWLDRRPHILTWEGWAEVPLADKAGAVELAFRVKMERVANMPATV